MAVSSHKRRKSSKVGHYLWLLAHRVAQATASKPFLDPKDLPMRMASEADLRSWLDDKATERDFLALDQAMLQPSGRRQAVSDADGYALFAIARGLQATRALEIGTHLGISAVHIAAGLSGPGAKLTTVDICDVNDPVQAPYKRFGSSLSARERAEQLGLADRIDFAISASHAFLRRGDERYDLIFVDGSHSEIPAYFDILYSLKRLRPGGLIVLHDVNDPDDPTPGVGLGKYGVHWALHRLHAQFPALVTTKLRSIPHPGVRDAAPTSLAVLSRR